MNINWDQLLVGFIAVSIGVGLSIIFIVGAALWETYKASRGKKKTQ